MADINVPLLVALGDRAAPQHKIRGQEAFEFSEGSDGALHTKIVDHNGNPISNSNKLQVADTDVKAELEQIKQQQQQILQRLNQPIDTQLTGSIVEKIFVFNAVAMDTTELFSQTFDVSKFQQIHILAQNTLNEVITIRMRIDGTWVRSEDDNIGSWSLATIEPRVNYTYSLNTYKPFLFQNVINTVNFYITTQNPPTSGSVTIKILGRY